MTTVEFGIPTDKSAPTVEYGVSRGIFREHGIDLKVMPLYGGPRIAAALTNGALHFAQIGTPPTIVAVSRGARFKIVGSAIRKKLHLYLGIRSGITDAAGLHGIRLGLLSMGSCDEWVARSMFAKLGLDPDTDVTFVPIHEDYARIVEMVRERRIDGALAIEPNMTQGEAEGVLRVWAAAYERDYLPVFQWTVLAASETLIRQDAELLRTLLQGYARSAHAAADDPEEYVAFVARRYGMSADIVRASFEREFPHYELDCRVDREGVDRALELQRSLTGFARPTHADEFLDLRFLPGSAGH